MKNTFSILLLLLLPLSAFTQDTICLTQTMEHKIFSEHLKEERNYWISLPLNYADSLSYPVIYVFDAEWRFELIKNIAFDLGGNRKIQKSIIVGIPHIDWEKKRGIDLTFSQSRIEYDGENVDSTIYNTSNSGGADKFYQYLTTELIPDVNKNYSTNNHETLIGHSYGGYFGGYILSIDHPFEVIHIYDPSIWFSNGEVTERLKQRIHKQATTTIHLTYQSIPEFHKNQIEAFIEVLERDSSITLSTKLYDSETHNSLFLDSFYRGILETNGFIVEAEETDH